MNFVLDGVEDDVASRYPSLASHQHYEAGSLRARLVALLNEFLTAGHFPRSLNKMQIRRDHFADLLGVTASSLTGHLEIFTSYEHILEKVEPLDALIDADPLQGDLGKNRQHSDALAVAADVNADEAVRRFPNLTIHQKYKAGSTKAKLVKMLNDCVVAGKFPRSRRNKREISRIDLSRSLNVDRTLLSSFKDILTAYEAVLEDVEPYETLEEAPAFGASPGSAELMDKDALEVVSRYPELLKHQHYPLGHTARSLVQLLNSQLCGGGLRKSRGGKVSRHVLTKQLGLSQPALTTYSAILIDYEDATGGRESKTELLVPSMRSWFEENMQHGTLVIRDGKISRIQFYDAFDLPSPKTVLIRYPRVAAVVEEFDRKVAETGYQPSEVASKVKELQALLADEPPIEKSGRSINLESISRSLGITPFHLRQPPYSLVIAEAQANLIRSLEADPLTVFACGRIFKFSSLVEDGWPLAYAVRVAGCFERKYRTKQKALGKSHYALLMDLLSFLSTNRSQLCRSVFYGIGNGVSVALLASEFTRALQIYRDHIRATNELGKTCNLKISSTNSILRAFSADSILPVPHLYLKGFFEGTKRHYKTVAEAAENAATKTGNPNVDDYLQFATAMLKQAAELRAIDLVSAETGDFTRVLRKELEADTFGAADNPASVILRVLERRLSLIKAAAWAKVEAGQRDLEFGHALLAKAVDPRSDFDRIIEGGGLGGRERDALLRNYFPVGENEEQGIANLLKVVETRYDRLYPAQHGVWEGQFFAKRAREYSGSRKLQSYLMPSQDVVAAALSLYLLESGSNVAVGRTLYFDSIEPDEVPHHCKVTGYKARAKGKPIFAIMADTSEAVKSMRWLQAAFKDFPGLDAETANQLFICKGRRSRGMIMIEEYTFRSEFKQLISSIPELAHLSMTPNMIRPSVLLRAALEHDGRTKLSIAIGQHRPDVHEGYVDRYPLRYLRDSEIRHFQHSLETVLIQAVEETHALLGVDMDAMGRRVESVMKTGLGTLCANRNGRPGNEGSPCTSVDCWNDCPQLIVIAKKEEVAILQVWQHSLRLVEGEWIQDQPERWEAIWLPWLCFIDAVEVKLRQSFGNVWKAASAISKKMIASPSFQPMRLF